MNTVRNLNKEKRFLIFLNDQLGTVFQFVIEGYSDLDVRLKVQKQYPNFEIFEIKEL